MKKKNLFMSTTIMCCLFAVSFKFDDDQISWLWRDNKPIPVIFVIIAIVLGTQWIKHQRQLNNVKRN